MFPTNWFNINQQQPEIDLNQQQQEQQQETMETFSDSSSNSSSYTSQHSYSYSSSSSSSSSSHSTSDSSDDWIGWFLKLPGHNWLTQVPVQFLEDDFNLTGLSSMVPFFQEALDVLLDRLTESVDPDLVESSAQLLYLLIHARWIITKQGLQSMLCNIETRIYGTCPRIYCHGYPLLPIGEHDLPGMGCVKLFCHSCTDLYNVPYSGRYSRLDGAAFGSSFPHILFLNYSSLHKQIIELTRTSVENTQQPNHLHAISQHLYVPRIFGFRLNERTESLNAPIAYWLRAVNGVDPRTGRVIQNKEQSN